MTTAPATEQIEVRLLDRMYKLQVPEAERNRLMQAVRLVDGKMREIRDTGRAQGADRIAVTAALQLVYELLSRTTAAEGTVAAAASANDLTPGRHLMEPAHSLPVSTGTDTSANGPQRDQRDDQDGAVASAAGATASDPDATSGASHGGSTAGQSDGTAGVRAASPSRTTASSSASTASSSESTASSSESTAGSSESTAGASASTANQSDSASAGAADVQTVAQASVPDRPQTRALDTRAASARAAARGCGANKAANSKSVDPKAATAKGSQARSLASPGVLTQATSGTAGMAHGGGAAAAVRSAEAAKAEADHLAEIERLSSELESEIRRQETLF